MESLSDVITTQHGMCFTGRQTTSQTEEIDFQALFHKSVTPDQFHVPGPHADLTDMTTTSIDLEHEGMGKALQYKQLC